MDPHERRAVYVARSGVAGGGEGLFARRTFLPGQLVSYLGGRKTFEEEFLLPNMTAVEEEAAAAYYFHLADNCPAWWGVPAGQVVDIPEEMRSITAYRTTLGHKVNNAFFKDRNSEFGTVRHPVLGPVACLLARRTIHRGEEVLALCRLCSWWCSAVQ